MIKLYKQATAVATTLLLSLFLLPSCSDGQGGTPEVPEARYAKLLISLHSMDNSTPAYTKAVDEDGYIVSDITNPDSADTAYEHHIDKWWIALLKKENDAFKFDRLITNDPTANNAHEDSETNITMELPVGDTYKFYAFANLDGLENGENVKSWLTGLTEETTESEIQTKAVALKALGNYHGGTGTSYIPMSSYGYTATIQETNNSVSIPLIRLLGKVKIDVENATENPVTITQLEMGKFRTQGDIFLLPYDVKTGDNGTGNLFVSAAGGEHKLLNPSFPTATTVGNGVWSLPVDDATANPPIAASATQSYEFYMNETAQENQGSNGEDMTITIQVEGLEKDPNRNTEFFFMRRNDLLRIPILISNSRTGITVKQSHMPIGGVPTVLIFPEGPTISDKTVDLDHAGEVTISYVLESVTAEGSWELVYVPTTGVEAGKQYCNAQLINADLDGDTHPLVLEPEEKDKVPLNWLGTGKWGYKLENTAPTSGEFHINVQELASGTATVKLTLVATNGTSETVLPYTLTLRYGEATKNTTEGGNS